jgi:precorrin-3B C17-methyltransferase
VTRNLSIAMKFLPSVEMTFKICNKSIKDQIQVMAGKIYIVGIGPGKKEHLSFRAAEVIESADVVVGYKTYIDILSGILHMNSIFQSGMTKEIDRCRKAMDFALEGKSVALVSSGDPGIYGMAGLMLEIISHEKIAIEVEVLPGITSSSASASVLGAPLMHDFATISLSDLLTDWDTIKTRIECAAMGDFVVCFYNPKSKKRISHIEEARIILLKYRDKNTPVGIVRNALRDGESHVISTLDEMSGQEIDMLSTVIVGNSRTFVSGGRMITPRGYILQ